MYLLSAGTKVLNLSIVELDVRDDIGLLRILEHEKRVNFRGTEGGRKLPFHKLSLFEDPASSRIRPALGSRGV